jgi:hypothetical protein
MSVNNETTRPEKRSKIDIDRSPAPPWSGVKYECANAKCKIPWQLEAADKCTEIFVDGAKGRTFKTPPCPKCGCVSSVDLPVEEEEQLPS